MTSGRPRPRLRIVLWLCCGLGLVLGAASARAQQNTAQQNAAQQYTAQQGTARGEASADQVIPVTATGRSTYRPDDLARSRDEAVEAARRDAIEQASGVFISSESEMQNYDLVRDDVLSRSEGYLKSAKIIQEGVVDHLYQVRLEAQVVKGAFLRQFHNSLADLYQRVGKPRLMMALHEHSAPDACAGPGEGEQGPGTRELRKMLLAEGFTFVDPQAANRDLLLEVQTKGKQANPKALTQLGQSSGAEILIVGDVRCADIGVVDHFHRAQAWMSLDVLRADTSQVLASQTSNAIGVHVSDNQARFAALQKVAQDIVPQLIRQITYQWIKEKQEGATIQLTVRNVSYDDLVQLRKMLANQVGGVRQVTQRSYEAGTAQLVLTTRYGSDRLAESIRAARYADFALEIVSVTPGALAVNFKKSAPPPAPATPPAPQAPAPRPAAQSPATPLPAESSPLAPPVAIPAPQAEGGPSPR